MTFDPTKPVQTRDGRPARIICTDRKLSDRPIVALVADAQGTDGEIMRCYCTDGTSVSGKQHDLINVPETRRVYVGAYDDGTRYYESSSTAHSFGYLEYTDDQIKK